MIKRICRICKKEFWVFPSAIKRNRSKTCSVKCANQSISQTMKGKMPKFIPDNIGRKHSAETKKKISKNRKGKYAGSDNCRWKGGKLRAKEGYIYILKRNHPFATKQGYILEHRFAMEKCLSRYLKPEEIVHHINGIVDDNRIENLRLFSTKSVHTKFHQVKN